MSNLWNVTMPSLVEPYEKPKANKTWPKRRVSLLSSNPTPLVTSSSHQPTPTLLARKPCEKASQLNGHQSKISSKGEVKLYHHSPLESKKAVSLQYPRKKSGEVVKPALKSKESEQPELTSIIPTKFVHFDAQLEYIKLFMKGEKPQTISNPGSDAEDGTSSDDDFYDQDEVSLSIRLPNFQPSPFSFYTSKAVSIDSITLSQDKKKLVGGILVANLAYHKHVSIRYTFDFWQTTEEISADFKQPTTKEFNNGIGIDEFSFSIDLEKRISLELSSPKKTLFLAVKYQVDNQEYWDNNDGMNYHVEFVLSKTRNGNDPWDTYQSMSVNSKSQPIEIKRSSFNDSNSLLASSPESPLVSLKSASTNKLSSRYDFEASLSALLAAETHNPQKKFSSYLDCPTSDQIDRQYESYSNSPAFSTPSTLSKMLSHEYDSYSSASVESPFGNNSWEEPTYLLNAYDSFSRNYVSNTPSCIPSKSGNSLINARSENDSDNHILDGPHIKSHSYGASPAVCNNTAFHLE
ncbi:hypothetical protein K7432_002980 [Basidiobolus ranarum]|uniref:CBM21 domain-containing protein n=1 Tax=Basidiobolus ranarum TaxID=34480 RepID=A0ABR2X0P5_9FUNG